MTVQEALQALVDKGARIEQFEADMFTVYDNGFWGFLNEEDPFVVDGDGILELYNTYIHFR